MASSSTQPNISTSTPKYIPPHRRHSSGTASRSHSPLYRRGQPFLTYEDLHAKYSPPNSPPLHMPRVQRSLSAEDLRHRFHKQKNQPRENQSQDGQIQGHDPPNIPAPAPSPPPRDLRGLRRPRSPSPPRQALRLSLTLPDPPVFNGINNHVSFDE